MWPTPNVPNGDRKSSDADIESKGSTDRGKRQIDLGSVARYWTARQLWPTATANDARAGRNRTAGRSDPSSGHHDGRTLTDAIRLWSTPSAGNFNDSETPQSWRARAEQQKARGINGNGAGMPLAIQAKETVGKLWATPSARDWRSAEHSDETWEKNARPLNEQALRLQRGHRSPTTPLDGEPTSNDTPNSLQLNPLFDEWLLFGRWMLGWTCVCPARALARAAGGSRPSAMLSAPTRLPLPCASSGVAPSETDQ